MIAVRSSAESAVEAALNQMRLEGIITQFDMHLGDQRGAWTGPQITVWIAAQDELSLARACKWVQEALGYLVPGVTVDVYPDPLAGGRL